MTKRQLEERCDNLEALVADGLMHVKICQSLAKMAGVKFPRSTENNWTNYTKRVDVHHESELKLIARANRLLGIPDDRK